MRRGLAWILCALVCLAAAGPAAAAGRGDGDRTRAERALERVKELRQGVGVRSGRELTVALADLVRRRGALDARGRREADAVLARPTDGNSDPQNDGYTVAEVTPYCLTSFCVHYVTSTADAPSATDTAPANGVPDYVEQMAAVFETEVQPCENGIAALGCAEAASSGLGWPAAPSDGTRGGNAKFDVYLKQLGDAGIFGYVAPDPDQPSGSSLSSYLVMDDDYAQAEYGYPDPLDPLRVTAAHEYNHVLQFGIEAFQDTWMFESTATWVEDKVYPSIDDYVFYLGDWVKLTDQPLTAAPGDSVGTGDVREDLKIYGSAVWNHWLSGRFGDDVILEAWDASTDGGGGPIATGSYNTAIVGDGGVGFSREFEHFSVATAEWRAPGAGFPDNAEYPDIPASERPNLSLGAAATSLTLDHTTFALRTITPPSSAISLRLNATLPAGLKGAIALVGRSGSDTGGTVEKQVQHTTNGGNLAVTLPNANSYTRITAVFVNSDDSQTGWHMGKQDWNWSKDNQGFTNVTVRAASAPTVTTEAATSVAKQSATLNGTVNPNGTATTYYFEYGPTTSYGTQIPVTAASAGSGTSAVPVSANLTGLAPGATYHYRLVAANAQGTTLGGDQTFTTLLEPPLVTTGAASSIGTETATLNGTVNPRGQTTTYYFEYGPTTSYGTEIPVAPGDAGNGTSAVPVSANLTGLTRGATYHFRLVATNADGTSNGADQSFTTLDPPDATTDAATAITANGATLNATLDPNGKSTTYKFEYGTTTSYGSQVTGGPTTTSGPVSLPVSGLTRGTTYHFRFVATNADGTTTGSDLTFTTKDPPVVTTGAATSITETGATLAGTVDPRGQSTTYKFEYGTTTAYGSEIAGAGAVTDPGAVGEPVTGLTPNTTYHYRLVATNADGTTHGSDGTFTTHGPPTATTGTAGGVGETSATLNGTVNPGGSPAQWWFEYGTTTAYGTQIPLAPADAGSGTSPVSVAQLVTGLAASTTYHYRLVAADGSGTYPGADRTVTTTAPAPAGDGGTSTPATSEPAPAETPPAPLVTTPPALALTLTAARTARLSALLRRGVRARATCSVGCRVTARLVLSRAAARRLGVPRLLGRATRSLTAATPSSVVVRVIRRLRRKVALARSLVLTLEVVATDAAGRRVTARRAIRVRR